MKVLLDRDQLTVTASRAAQGLPQNPVIPVRAGMLITTNGDHVRLSCGDEDVIFTARMSAEVAEDGTCILPGKMVTEVIRYLPKQEVVIETQGDRLAVITCGRSSFTLGARDGKEYPGWMPPPAALCSLEGTELAAGLRKVAPAASDDLPILSGILLTLSGDRLTLVATDKYKLGMMELDVTPSAETQTTARTLNEATETIRATASDNTKTHAATPSKDTKTNLVTALLPSRVAEKFARACEGSASIGWSDNPKLISLHSEGLLVVSRQTDGKLPGWEKIMQGERVWWAVETAELTRAVRMAALAATDDRIELFFDDGEIMVCAHGARQVAECGYDGEPVTIAVGGRNLLAGLNGCGEMVRLSVSAPMHPLLLDSEGLRWLVQTRRET